MKYLSSGFLFEKYIWTADGTKIGVKAGQGDGYGFAYLGSMVFTRTGSNMVELESVAFPEGRFEAGRPVFFVTDHLGSVRAEVDGASKAMLSANDYMPFGERFSADGYGQRGRYLFSGKEKQTTYDLNLLDFGARMYDSKIPRWMTQDPLAEKYYNVSPYAYCGGNPVNRIDPDGMAYGDFHDENGNFLGTDGIDDNKKYFLKTRQKTFNESTKDEVKGAGLSGKAASATKKFIKDNSGNTKAFEENSIAYDNSIGLEISSANASAMEAEVGRDNGAGGTSDANNREYGGTIIDGKVVLATHGNVGNPRSNVNPEILLQGGGLTFHSHPSGNIPSTSNGVSTTRGANYTQHPSSQDVSTSGSRNHLVFGRGNGQVYIYNSSGIQARIPARAFTKIFK